MSRTLRRVQSAPFIMTELTIESLDQDGRGIAHVDGKVVFVEGGLPGEQVGAEIVKRKPSYDVARALTISVGSADRVVPRCPHFGVCGGCTLQHAGESLQLAAKQRALEDSLLRIGRLRPDTLLPAIAGPAWEYRFRARLSVRDVPKKGGVLIGFHERRSSYVADMRECHVLPAKISGLLPELRRLVESLSVRTRLPQIEVAVGERLAPALLARSEGAGGGTVSHTGSRSAEGDVPRPRPVYALVLRILDPLAVSDEAKLVAFADRHGV
jgi:23S rRNA (uracil1939-C5)-methyltransferase